MKTRKIYYQSLFWTLCFVLVVMFDGPNEYWHPLNLSYVKILLILFFFNVVMGVVYSYIIIFLFPERFSAIMYYAVEAVWIFALILRMIIGHHFFAGIEHLAILAGFTGIVDFGRYNILRKLKKEVRFFQNLTVEEKKLFFSDEPQIEKIFGPNYNQCTIQITDESMLIPLNIRAILKKEDSIEESFYQLEGEFAKILLTEMGLMREFFTHRRVMVEEHEIIYDHTYDDDPAAIKRRNDFEDDKRNFFRKWMMPYDLMVND